MKKVTKTKKDTDDDIMALCGPEFLSPVNKAKAIQEIESAMSRGGKSPYYVEVGFSKVEIHVVERATGKHLRTDRDKTIKNNLAELPDC